ncbi:MAG TPA: 4-(cytidine 5'-diphospho)-2-C-methyl-D-erythritol kinase [Candidatus Krumholzibacteria bacterium]|nr:4-(cytidine 5'-diphospho)-2-C-methyl-D-erythritol kinase [Candidatus Krumholzibacteria bacterium]
MREKIVARTPAKVNLHLEVLYQREDGYHEIETIFQALDLYDTITFEATNGPIHVTCAQPGVPNDRTNLCHRAAKMVRNRTGVRAGASIHIDKTIPVAAGLGGGSSDAAATLLAVQRLWGLDLDDDDVLHMATTLGADVPFFLRGGVALGRGIGEQLTPLNASGMGVFLLVTPPMSLSAADAYEGLRMGLTRHTPKVNLQTIKALLSRFPDRMWPGHNRLADFVFPTHPQLRRLHLMLLDTGPRLAMLSGSGPTVYAVYATIEEAESARERLSPTGYATRIARPIRHGVTLIDS